MALLDDLLDSERRLVTEGGPAYEELLRDDALVIVPGAVLDKAQCVAAILAAPGWDETHMRDARLVRADETAVIVYAFAGRRGETAYTANLASTYVRGPEGWRLLLHQQTAD